MRSREELLEAAEHGVKVALSMGADEAEIYLQSSEVGKVAASGRLASPASSDETSLGVRLVAGGRVGVSGAASMAGLRGAIREALASVAGVASRDAAAELPPPAHDGTPRAPRGALEDAEAQADVVRGIVDAALADPRVTFVECKAVAAHRRIAIASSRGVRAWDETVSHRLELELRATRGTTHRSGREIVHAPGPLAATLDPGARVSAIVERLARALDGGKHEGAPLAEAVFSGASAGQILGIASQALLPRREGAREIGAALYAPTVTLRDEPRGPAGVRRRHVDDEGTPTTSRTLVERGALVARVHDHQSARRAGVASTGNGMRSSASGGVSPKPVNLALAPGDASLDELVEQTERGILVTEPFLGGFTSNLATGDFSVVVPYAFLVESGRVRRALGPTTIGGNAHAVLASARALGRERIVTSAGVTPAILAGGVSCAT